MFSMSTSKLVEPFGFTIVSVDTKSVLLFDVLPHPSISKGLNEERGPLPLLLDIYSCLWPNWLST